MLLKPFFESKSPTTKNTVSSVNTFPPDKDIHACSDLVVGLLYLKKGNEFPILCLEDEIKLNKLIHENRRGNFLNCTSFSWLLCKCHFAKLVRLSDMLILDFWEKKRILEEIETI